SSSTWPWWVPCRRSAGTPRSPGWPVRAREGPWWSSPQVGTTRSAWRRSAPGTIASSWSGWASDPSRRRGPRRSTRWSPVEGGRPVKQHEATPAAELGLAVVGLTVVASFDRVFESGYLGPLLATL